MRISQDHVLFIDNVGFVVKLFVNNFVDKDVTGIVK